MASLTREGLLTKKFNKYSTTDKGYRLIELFNEVTDLLGKI